jgi:hypothetical protein
VLEPIATHLPDAAIFYYKTLLRTEKNHTKSKNESKFCSEYGYQLEKNATFCGECGIKLL